MDLDYNSQNELNKAVEFLNDSQKVEVNMLESVVKEFSED